MSEIINKLSDRLARPTPRRGFLRAIGMGLAGGAAAAAGAGGALLSGQGPHAALASLGCCKCSQPGCTTVYCGQDMCLRTEMSVNGPSCCVGLYGPYYTCVDCLSLPNKDYICTWGQIENGNCQKFPTKGPRASKHSVP